MTLAFAQAVSPFSCVTDFDVTKIQHLLEGSKVQCAAVCVYPSRIEDASAALTELGAEKDVLVAAGKFLRQQYFVII